MRSPMEQHCAALESARRPPKLAPGDWTGGDRAHGDEPRQLHQG